MVNLARHYNFSTKEHNGDYIPVSTIHEKFKLGLEAINIAPEFGLIETQTYLDEIAASASHHLFDKFFDICYASKKWVKWVDADFDPFEPENKLKLVKISGHYVLSSPEFIENIKSIFPIDREVQRRVIEKLKELHA
jgi:hypothetical protein